MNKDKIQKEFATRLVAAVIERACEDYKIALKNNYVGDAQRLEDFFLSTEGQTMCRGRGRYIIDRLRKEVIEDDNRRSNERCKNEERGKHRGSFRKNRYFGGLNPRVRKRPSRT